MSKSSFLNNKILQKSNIAIICILGMFAGFLLSRAMLSIAMILFGFNGIRDVHPKEWLKNKWWLLGLCWIACYAISWFWSDDKGAWHIGLEVKLPFLILPLAFAFLPRFTARQMQILTLGIGFLLLCSACYSVSFLLRDPAHYVKEYKISHVLPTLPKHDHIRASMATSLYIVWAMYSWPSLTKTAKWLTSIICVLLGLYLHILAAKTGILSLYIFIAGYGLYLAFARRKLAGLIIILAIPLCALFALHYIPTFRERANYIGFSLFMLQHGDKSGNIGDIARLMSYKIAGGLIKEHPLYGVGTGDMKAEMDKQYIALYPNIPEYAKLVPHNQFLTIGLGCGIPAMLLFAWWVFAPLGWIGRNRRSVFFLLTWLILFIQLMIEPVLEVQFGVFVFAFFLLLFLHEFPAFLQTKKQVLRQPEFTPQ